MYESSGHDPLCPTRADWATACECALIARVRAEYGDTDWGFCHRPGCTIRVPIERDPLLCDEHWEAHIRADERERGDGIARGMVAQARREVAEEVAQAIEAFDGDWRARDAFTTCVTIARRIGGVQ